jgi:hypothetical protein
MKVTSFANSFLVFILTTPSKNERRKLTLIGLALTMWQSVLQYCNCHLSNYPILILLSIVYQEIHICVIMSMCLSVFIPHLITFQQSNRSLWNLERTGSYYNPPNLHYVFNLLSTVATWRMCKYLRWQQYLMYNLAWGKKTSRNIKML